MLPYTCRSVTRFEKLNLIGEGTYGTVYRARDRSSGQIVALKKIRPMKSGGGGFPLTSVREVALLQQVKHPAIIKLREIAVGRKVSHRARRRRRLFPSAHFRRFSARASARSCACRLTV